MSGAENDFWVRPCAESEQAEPLDQNAALLWADWLCLLCSGDCTCTSEWGRRAVPYIDKMMRRLREVEHGGAWESEGL